MALLDPGPEWDALSDTKKLYSLKNAFDNLELTVYNTSVALTASIDKLSKNIQDLMDKFDQEKVSD